MSDWKNCPSCKSFAQMSHHACQLEWEVYDPDNFTEADAEILPEYHSIEAAVENIVEEWATEDGFLPEVRVMIRRARSSDPWREFSCTVETVPKVSATEKKAE